MKEDFLSQFSRRYSLSPKRFYSVKRKYLGLYKAQLLKMYDMGYTNEVSVFSESDFMEAYSSEGVNLKFLDGKIKLEPWVFYLEYALSGYSNEFYSDMYELLSLRASCKAIDLAYDGLKMYRAKSTKSLSWSIDYTSLGLSGVSRSVSLLRNAYELLIDDTSYVKDFELRPLISFGFEEMLFPELDDDSKQKELDDIVILGNVTYKEVSNVIEEILQGGIYLEDSPIKELISEYGSGLSLITELYYRGKERSLEYLSGLTFDERAIPLGADNLYIYLSLPKDNSYSEQIPFGAFSVDYDTSEVLPSINNFYGVTGDFVNLDSPLFREDGHFFVGCPIQLVTSDGTKSLYVDVEQVTGLGESSLIYDLGLTLSFSQRGSYHPQVELGLVDFYVNSYNWQEEGMFSRLLVGNYSDKDKDIAIKKAMQLLGVK